MSLKVGTTPPTAGVAASSRAAAVNHIGPAAFAAVSALNGSRGAGPQEDSLRFSDTWEEMQQRRQRRNRQPLPTESLRLGGLLTSDEMSYTLMSHRAGYGLSILPSLRFGAMVYQNTSLAITFQGALRPPAEHFNRLP